jgi:outer membrane receptor protein involved in Fe transport
MERPDQLIRNVHVNAWYQKGDREFDAYLYHVPKGTLFVNNKLNAHRKVKTVGATLQSGLAFAENHLLTWGLDVFGEEDDTQRIADAAVVTANDEIKKDPPADLTPPTPKSWRRGWAVFMEDELNVTKTLTLNSGLRYDAIKSHANGVAKTLTPESMDTDHSDFSGGLGAVLKLGADTRLTANIGRAFKAPALQERYFKGTAQVGYLEGNPDLKSETSLNLDLGFKHRHDRWEFSLQGFRNAINDFIVMKPISAAADSFLYDNVGKAILVGGEIEAAYHLSPSLRIFGNVAYVRAKDTELNEDLPKTPPLNGLLSLRYSPAFNKYWIELQGQFTSKQDKVAENEATTDGYNLFHISAGINLQTLLPLPSPVHLTLNIRNLLDESYRNHLSTVTWWDAPGRNVIIGLRGEF